MSERPSIPITMLSGFLGAGKTTILRELLLQNKFKVGCVVNDVAAVNIDAKLIRNQNNTNAKATTTSDLAPTIELQNGCACCTIQDELFLSFEQILGLADKNGVAYDRIVLENSGVAEPQNIRDAFAEITVVDSHTFIKEYADRNPVATRPDLGGDDSSFRPVVDLLVEQVEVADYVVLNKVDMLGEARLPELQEIVSVVNPLCEVVSCSHGKVDMDALFGPAAKQLMAQLNTEGQHRGYIAQAKKKHKANSPDAHAHGHDHAHGQECKKEGCTDPSHTHSHQHDEGDGHEHTHSHSHGHGHSHSHGDGGECQVAGCTDAAHHHHHDHKHDGEQRSIDRTTAHSSRRRPFHPHRLRETVVRWMPVSTNKETGGTSAPENNDSPIRTVMRSKGFMWLSSGHATAFYWSHAGQHFEIREEGDWWAAVPEEDWPRAQAQRAVIFSDFDTSGRYGDRRQEIVFIGAGMDQGAIEAALDAALLTDEELAKYDENWAKLPDPQHAGAAPSAGGAAAGNVQAAA